VSKIALPRLLLWIIAGTFFYVALQYLPGLFYARQFDDFVRDEVRFAPVREKSQLVQHIIEGAHDCHIEVDQHQIQIVKTRDMPHGVNTLTVDVAYQVPIHIFGWTRELPRSIEGTVKY